MALGSGRDPLSAARAVLHRILNPRRPIVLLGRRLPPTAVFIWMLAAALLVLDLLAWTGSLRSPNAQVVWVALWNGLIIGGLYALIAVGYTVVYGILKFINFAHGEVFMVAPYLLIVFAGTGPGELGLPFMVAAGLAVGACGLLGAGIERVAYRRLRKAGRLSPLITAIGVSLFLQAIIQLAFTANARITNTATNPSPDPWGRHDAVGTPPGTPPDPWTLTDALGARIAPGLPVTLLDALIIVAALATMAGLYLLITRSRLGIALRATADDIDTAELVGIPVNRVVTFAFVLGSMLAGIAGIAYGLRIGEIRPVLGVLPGLKAFAGAVVGGIGSIPGAFLGGLLIGLTEELAMTVLPSEWRDAVAFVVLILVLLVRPSGILGRPEEVRR